MLPPANDVEVLEGQIDRPAKPRAHKTTGEAGAWLCLIRNRRETINARS